jgi:hypothetical protein
MRAAIFLAAAMSLSLVSTGVQGDIRDLKASPGLSVGVGLDDSTKQLIEELPAEVRKQIFGLLQDALPLIDQSVEKYLARIDEIMNKQIDNAKCAVLGSAKQIKDELGTLFIGKPTPVVDLRKDFVAIGHDFDAKSNPLDYVARYADFLQRAGVTRCQAVDPDVSVAVADMQLKIRPRFRVWGRSKDLCANASDCVEKITLRTKTMIASANARDVKEVDAAKKLGSIQQPRAPRLFESFDPTGYEQGLLKLFSIEDAINIARLKRLSVAQAAWKKANDAFPKMEALYENENSQVNWPTAPVDLTNALSRCKLLVQQIKAINSDAKTAAQLDDSYQGQYEEFRQKLQIRFDNTFALYAKAAERLNTLKKAFGGKPDIPPGLPKELLD